MIDTSQLLRNINPSSLEAMKSAYSATETQQTVETGKAMGYSLKVMEDPGASLLDSMEELAMSFEEKKMTEISQRRLGEVRGKSSLLLAMIEKWTETLPGMPDQAHLEKLLGRIRSMALRGDSAADLLKLLDGETGDATEQFAMLDILANAGGIDEATSKLIAGAMRLLEQTRGEEVRAGLNLAETVNAQTGDHAELKELRSLYRSEVLGYRNPQDCFRSLLAQRGPEGLKLSIAFLVEACGVDMASAHPSKSAVELARILTDLQCVNSLAAMMDKAGTLVGKMMPQFGERCALDGAGLMNGLLAITEKANVDNIAFALLMQTTGLQSTLAQLYFMTALIDLVRQLSPRVFEDEAQRLRMVDAAQAHLDGLVERQSADDERQSKEGGK